MAYVNKPGTLYTAMRHTYGTTAISKLGYQDPNNFRVVNLRDFTLLGTPSAHDFNGGDAEAIKYDAEGHFVFDREADETKTDINAGIGGTRQLLGTHKEGAINGAQLERLDLGDAIITDAHCSDLTISWSYSAQSTTLKEIIFPTTPLLKTLPADCLNGHYALLEEFCIPGNIEVLKTRACLISTRVLRHVWTTDPVSGDIIDNGAYTIDPDDRINPAVFDHYGHAPLTSDVWNCGREDKTGVDNNKDGTFGVSRYGTITLPQNLRLIESNNFTAQFVSDVYSLNPVAPECHVDAFSSIMYLGNNTIDTQYIKEMGMVTREAYAQDVAAGEYIAFLHYPPTIGTPEIQRYTDPTREYSVATTLRDGKGNVIYFPNQSELNRAYIQGTTGYLWFAWDSERVPEGSGDNANSFVTGLYADNFGFGHSTSVQEAANDLYIANQMTNPDKTDRSFYDVRLDENGQPTLAQPDGLKWYYNTEWEGVQLYPQPTIEGVVDGQGNPVMVTVPVTDNNGNIIYDELPPGSPAEGNYTKATEQQYIKAADGTFCHPLIQDGNGQYTIEYEYTLNTNGDGIYCKAPWNSNVWTIWESWMGNIQRYDRAVSGIIKYDNQKHNDGRPRFNIGTDYVDYESYNNEYKEVLDRYNLVDVDVYSPANEGDPGPYYKMRTQVVQDQVVTEKKDYRGWHQFVLAAYGPAGDPKEETVVKFYQTDSDWWTVCLPYDLKYSEMKEFFGNGNKIPYLSKLRYVVRDYDQQKITLMFSKNLMVYKEDVAEGKVHGVIDDKTKWPETNGEGLSIGTEGYYPVILRKGVPYLIKPEIPVGANRSFTVAKDMNADLYQRLVDAEHVDGGTLETYIYQGEYTVPAYVVGTTTEGTTTSRKLEDYSYTNTYTSNDEIMYGGQPINAPVSSEYSYTFVGSFFLSVLPQYCYFLGWDSKRNCAAFWYNVTPNLDDYEWNNQTGVICANFNNATLIHKATGLNDPARWKFTAVSTDDLKVASSAGAPKKYDMSYGGSINMAINDPENPLAEDFGNQEVLSIDEIQSLDTKSVWYNVSGQKLNGRPTQSGVYIMNGKKYVVK